ncbi:formate/nitrite transporter family protein [Thalassospiraceae bacterium LMO-SO8]|nr:formate/nitrite transporter family protein [Alphaproteobacteria bacterium LMO-S08]WND77900.1 formate/nitrite transporter family protein [Thalassospiraceae bacterium LMO-SO8]
MADQATPPGTDPGLFDAYAPAQMARRVEVAGVAKAGLPLLPLFTLALLAGAFIAFGAMMFTLTMTDHGMGLGPSRILGGVTFSLGLILVVVGGAELFTGNLLLVMGWADRKIATAALLRNWIVAYGGNLSGAVAMAFLAHWSGYMDLGSGAVGATAVKIAAAKVDLDFATAFVRGILCNTLVCLAVWLCFASHNVIGKIFAILFPITAFVALGFEHSIANMFFIPVGMLAAGNDVYVAAAGLPGTGAGLTLAGFVGNLVPVTLGNMVGGGLFVAGTYYIVYLRPHS